MKVFEKKKKNSPRQACSFIMAISFAECLLVCRNMKRAYYPLSSGKVPNVECYNKGKRTALRGQHSLTVWTKLAASWKARSE
jgi:hypothetical protein